MEVLFVRHRLFLHPVGRNPGLLNLNEAAARATSDQVIRNIPWFAFAQMYEDPCISIPAEERFEFVRRLSLSILLGP